MKYMKKPLLYLILMTTLTACGYHLHGSVDVPEIMRHIHVRSASPQLLAGFKESLNIAGGRLNDMPERGGLIVQVLNEHFDRRSLSLSSTGKANEFELIYTLEFEVLTVTENTVIMPRQTVEVNRDYYNDQQDIMGKGNEEAQIRQEMYLQAVRAVIDRGRALL